MEKSSAQHEERRDVKTRFISKEITITYPFLQIS